MATRDEKIEAARVKYGQPCERVRESNGLILRQLAKVFDESIAQAANAYLTVCDTAVDDE